MANFIVNTSQEGLGTYSVTIPTTDIYMIQGTLTLPNIVPSVLAGPGGGAGTGSGGGPEIPSQVVVVVNQNGTPRFTSSPGSEGFILRALPCTAGDVLTFVRSSSLSQDQQPNAVKMTLAISEGAI